MNTSSFSAQYGIGGIIFNQVTKSGTNSFHGTAYDFIQNDMFTAHPYFDTGAIPFLRYNNFGGTIGGPVIKNKMFFYFNYDQIVNHGNSHGFNTLPTDANIGGDFTGMNTIFDPTTQTIAFDCAGKFLSGATEFCVRIRKWKQDSHQLVRPGGKRLPKAFFPTTANHPSFLTPIPGGDSVGGEGQ